MSTTKAGADAILGFWKTPGVTGTTPGNAAPVLNAGTTSATLAGNGLAGRPSVHRAGPSQKSPDHAVNTPETPSGGSGDRATDIKAEIKDLSAAREATQVELDLQNRSADHLINEAQGNPPRTRDYPEQMGRHPEETHDRLANIRDNPAVHGQKLASEADSYLREIDRLNQVQGNIRQRVDALVKEGLELQRRPGVESNAGGPGGGTPPTQTTPAATTKMSSSTGTATPPQPSGGGTEHGGGAGDPTGDYELPPWPPGAPPPPDGRTGEILVGDRTRTQTDGAQLIVETVIGPEDMTVDEYRRRVGLARESIQIDRKRNPGLTEEQLTLRAAQEHRLDLHWQDIDNPNYHPPRNAGGGGTTSGAGGEPHPPGVPQAPATPPATEASTPAQSFDINKFEHNAAEVVRQVEDRKKALDEIQTRLEKSRSPAESKKLRQELDALGRELEGKSRVELENLAKEIVTAPEMAGVTAGTPKGTISKARETFSKVAAAGSAIGPRLLQVENAFELVMSMKDILTADSAMEGMVNSLTLGWNFEAGSAEYALAEYLSGSSAVGWAVVGLITMPSDQGSPSPAEMRRRVKEGAVIQLIQSLPEYSQLNYGNVISTKLFDEMLTQVNQLRKEQLMQQAKEVGIQDGLAGTKTDKDDLEPGREDKEDIGISLEDLLPAYQEGMAEGKRRQEAAIKRAHDAGFKDGNEGKPANVAAIKDWPEFKAIRRKPQKKLSNDEFIKVEGAATAYSDNYDKGYQEGQKTAKALVVTEFKINPNGFSMGCYTARKLTATLVFSNKSTKDVSDEVHWKSSDDKIVVIPPGQAVAFMREMGRADVTGSYAGIFGSHDATIKITVKQPFIVVDPETITLGVGAKKRFRAVPVDQANDLLAEALDSGAVSWGSDDNARVSIDPDGNATVLAAGDRPVTINASHKFSMAQGRAVVTIR